MLIPSQNNIITLFFLLLIILLGWVLRYGAATNTVVDTPVRADAQKYVLYAYNLNEFGIYTYSRSGVEGNPEDLQPDALVTPAYPLFISFFLRNGAELSYDNILITQAFLGTLCIILVYLLFLNLGHIWALLIAFITACSPHLVSIGTYLLTETLFCFFLLGFLFVYSQLERCKNWYLYFFLTGLLLALATLTRPWTQGFLVILLLFFWFNLSHKRLQKILLLIFGFAVIITPWLIRNHISLDVMVDPALSFTSIHHGMYPDMMYNNQPESLGRAYHFDPWVQNTVITKENVLNELSQRVLEQPWVYAQWYMWGKTITVFSWDILAGMGDIFVYPVIQTPYATDWLFKLTHTIMWILHPILVVLSLIGVVLAWLPAAKQLPSSFLWSFRLLSLLMLYFVMLHIIGAPFPRYSIPMRPVIYGMAIAVLAWLSSYVTRYITHSRV
ncbi:phospholipid carrier-dependent glycosyltransferase [Candidatus Venteria ishoeyi]|uniref:Dolichyl-phosphate-mannose-protein mannosyltransferase n=1 Tax=Candidatus Venteria ishoeyi TaxID=1899563 RepID=A0A1H6F5X1_9GAMM|nr:phospholipid carrier-dependent glycosyltransferase [Candidatus Venteria ishoeyi]SEH05568.1 Dolichyl-phosphate-mannose-protein mannosyltransferase [Candidatus Venteria ishoeyi]